MTDSGGNRANRVRGAWLLVAALVLGAVLASVVLRPPGVENEVTPTVVTFTGDPAAVERGSELFASQCVSCHGVAGKGDGPLAASLEPRPIDFTNSIHRMHTDVDLTNWIANGVPGSAMPSFAGTLTEIEIADLITFIRSLQSTVTTASDLDVPDPALCTINPVLPQAFLPEGTPTPKPAPTPAADVGPNSFPWPQGEPANQKEIDGITRTIREFHACANAGDYPRRLALYSDRAIRPQFEALDSTGWQSAIEFAATPPVAVPVGERGWIDSISDVQRLPDGRVGAYIAAIDPVNHPHQVNAVVIFANVGDRWLIDEVHSDPGGNRGVATTPVANSGIPSAGIETPITSSGLIVTLIEAPTTFGIGLFIVEVTTANGDRVEDATVTAYVEMAEMFMGVQKQPANHSEGGRYEVEIPIGMTGIWQIQVVVSRSNEGDANFIFTFPIA